MATFAFNQKRTKELVDFWAAGIEENHQECEMTFQPMHRGGCIQIMTFDNVGHFHATSQTGFHALSRISIVPNIQMQPAQIMAFLSAAEAGREIVLHYKFAGPESFIEKIEQKQVKS